MRFPFFLCAVAALLAAGRFARPPLNQKLVSASYKPYTANVCRKKLDLCRNNDLLKITFTADFNILE